MRQFPQNLQILGYNDIQVCFNEVTGHDLLCCCRLPPLSPLQTTPPGSSHSASGPRSVGNLGQLNKCLVSCGCEWHRGQFGVGCASGVILCRYSCRIGDLFVGSCARSLLV